LNTILRPEPFGESTVMALWQRFASLRTVGFLVVFLLVLDPIQGHSQGTAPANSAIIGNCRLVDFDTTFELGNGPGDYFTAAFRLRNISGRPCLLDRGSYGANGSPTNPDRTDPWGKVFVTTPDSTDRVWGTAPVIDPPATLDPGRVAYFTIRWKSKPSSESEPCIQPIAINWPVMILAPSLLRRLCSSIEVSAFTLSPIRNAADSRDEAEADPRNLTLNLVSDRRSYYQGERFFLHVASLKDEARHARSEDTCPFYLRERSSDGRTLFRAKLPVPPESDRDTHGRGVVLVAAPLRCDSTSGFELSPEFSDSFVGWKRSAEHTFQVFEAMPSPEDGPVHFAYSNIFRIGFVDGSDIPRKWGPAVMGVMVNATLDKDTFVVGEDVPLHLAVKNVDSEVPVYGSGLPDTSCNQRGHFSIEVRDQSGQTLHPEERLQKATAYDGTMFCPIMSAYPKGSVIPIETTLANEGWLPKHPGTYTVVVTLIPWLDSPAGTGHSLVRALPRDYSIQSEVVVHLVDRDSTRPR